MINTVSPRPVRLQLSRRAGFDLQALSRSVNGLPAVSVARPGKWGNPYRVGRIDPRTGGTLDAETAVERYLDKLVLGRLSVSEATARRELAGKNLACWCKPGDPCHADVLLEIANPPPRPSPTRGEGPGGDTPEQEARSAAGATGTEERMTTP